MKTMYLFLLVVVIWFIYTFIKLRNSNVLEKELMKCYAKFIKNKEDAYDYLLDFSKKNTKNTAIVLATNVLKLNIELDKGLDTKETLKAIDYKYGFFPTGKVNHGRVRSYDYIFMWSMLAMAKAYYYDRRSVAVEIHNKFDGLNDWFKLDLGYQLLMGIYDGYENNKIRKAITDTILSGYTKYNYNQGRLGFYKYMACAIYDKFRDDLKEKYEVNDLPAFAETDIGKMFTTNLETYTKLTSQK